MVKPPEIDRSFAMKYLHRDDVLLPLLVCYMHRHVRKVQLTQYCLMLVF